MAADGAPCETELVVMLARGLAWLIPVVYILLSVWQKEKREMQREEKGSKVRSYNAFTLANEKELAYTHARTSC